MISKDIQKQIISALRAGDEIRLSTLRMLSSALNYERIAKQHNLSSQEEIAVVRKEAKKRKDAIEAYKKAGAHDRAEKEKKELGVLSEFLPEEMEDSEIERIVQEVIVEIGASGVADTGKVMGRVMQKIEGRASGDRVSVIVRNRLQKGLFEK